MKIQKIEVKNFKAISEQSIDLNGCSAIVTAGNNRGKSSMLSGLIDRFRSEIPDIIVKEGEEKGYNVIHLTDGSRIEWKFTQKTESFHFVTKDGLTMKTGVLKQLSEKYFGKKFDVDKFIQSSPAEQIKSMQKIVGIDLSEIDEKITIASSKRRDAKKELDTVINSRKEMPLEVKEIDVSEIHNELQQARKQNQCVKEDYDIMCEQMKSDIDRFNSKQDHIINQKKELNDVISVVKEQLESCGLIDYIDLNPGYKAINDMPKPEEKKLYVAPEEPEYIDTTAIEKRLQEANDHNVKHALYKKELDDYNSWVEAGTEKRDKYNALDSEVKDYQAEKVKIISEASIPDDFDINDGELKYKGYPLSNSQISSSMKYIAALKLGSLVSGAVRTMHFDASFLDNNSLSEVQEWAAKEGLQLLIERPDYDGGEISYQLMEDSE